MTGGSLLLARVLLAVVFTTAGVAKLAARDGTIRAASQLLECGERLARLIASVLPPAEVAIALGLLIRPSARAAALVALLALVAFSAAAARAIARARRPECNCFGVLGAGRIGRGTLVRNLGLAAVAGYVAASHDGGESLGSIGETTVLAIGAALAVLAVLVAQSRLMLSLLRQNGRLLERVEALERRAETDQDARASGPVRVLHSAGNAPRVGEHAKRFLLEDTEGAEVGLDELLAGGLPVGLVFTAPGCGPCDALLPHLAEMQAAPEAAATLAVLSAGPPEASRARQQEHGLARVLLDPEGVVTKAYGIAGTPAALLLNPDRTVAAPVALGAEPVLAALRATMPVAGILAGSAR